MKCNKRLINLIIGPVMMIFIILLLPQNIFENIGSRVSIATVGLMAYWWVTAPIDYAVTAFLPIVLNAFIRMADMESVIANYASETIILLLASSILIASWEKTGLDKRISVLVLKYVGENLRKQYVCWFLLSAFLSAIIPNAVVCATIIPIAVSMLNYIGEGNISRSEVGSRLLLIIVYATSVGGLATPLGGAMNLITVDYLQQFSGEEYLYIDWVLRFIPIVIVLIISNIVFLIRSTKKDDSINNVKIYYKNQYIKFSNITYEEKISLGLFMVAVFSSFFRPFYRQFLPGVKPAYVFLLCAVISFMITDRNGNKLLTWKSVQNKIVWELIYIFAGGLAAGTIITESGASEAIGKLVKELNLDGGIITIFIILAVALLLSDITSNTATAAIMVPIVISIIEGIGENPIPFIYVTVIGVNLSYMLPTSIRAIPVGYGLEPKYMLREGWKLSIIVLIIMTILCAFLYQNFPQFSSIS